MRQNRKEKAEAVAEAVVKGLNWYKGSPCKRGHIGNRYVKGGLCVECVKLNNCVALGPRREDFWGYIYFVQAGDQKGPVKIGFTSSPLSRGGRLSDLQVGNHEPLNLIRVIRGRFLDESEMHKKFTPLPGRREWFFYDERMLTIELSDP